MSKRGFVISLTRKEVQYEAGRIIEEANKRGLSVDGWNWEKLQISFSQSKGVVVTHEGREIDWGKYAWGYFRPSRYKAYGGFTDIKTILVELGIQHQIKMLNRDAWIRFPNFSKTSQYAIFTREGLPVIEAAVGAVFGSKSQFPMMVKKNLSSMGEGVFLVSSEAELEKLIQSDSGNWLRQKYIPIKEDYRVLVIGGEAIGVMGRTLALGSWVTNISLGGKGFVSELIPSMKELAEKAIKVCGLDHGGVDLLRVDEDHFGLLEVNRLPQFQGFEKTTGINVAGKIIDYLIES